MKVYVWFWVTALLRTVDGFAGCPDGYTMYGGICYKAFNQRQNFLRASKKCSTDGGTLAMPKYRNTNAFLISLKNNVNPNRRFWFGLVYQHEEGSWEWIDGTPIGNYSDWGSEESSSQDDGDCARYSPTVWNDEECSEERRFICQIILAGCTDGYVYHEPSRVCYRAFNDEKNYDEAVATCSSDGGTLAMPRDTATNNFLIYLKNALDNSTSFRFGLTDHQREGTWVWADNVILGNFSAWGPGEPNNNRDRDCAEYFPGNHNHNSKKNKWNDGPCSRDNRKFICQVIPTDGEKKTPPWLVGVVCAAVVVLVIIAVVTVLLCRRKHNPCTNVPWKIGNEMKNVDTPERHDHTASEGTVNNIIYNTEDEGFVDNVIYQREDSRSNDQENAPESQYETVN